MSRPQNPETSRQRFCICLVCTCFSSADLAFRVDFAAGSGGPFPLHPLLLPLPGRSASYRAAIFIIHIVLCSKSKSLELQNNLKPLPLADETVSNSYCSIVVLCLIMAWSWQGRARLNSNAQRCWVCFLSFPYQMDPNGMPTYPTKSARASFRRSLSLYWNWEAWQWAYTTWLACDVT